MAFRPTQTRAFFRTLRTLIKEEHPFARNTSTLMPHKHDNSILMRRTFRTAATYTPFIMQVIPHPFPFSPLPLLIKNTALFSDGLGWQPVCSKRLASDYSCPSMFLSMAWVLPIA
ncbi:hypothetical protein D6D26_09767 [Aureobasidium pullulans]|nr:hypothetical protein D6D26_09767 [Aureobasidium pullulans]